MGKIPDRIFSNTHRCSDGCDNCPDLSILDFCRALVIVMDYMWKKELPAAQEENARAICCMVSKEQRLRDVIEKVSSRTFIKRLKAMKN